MATVTNAVAATASTSNTTTYASSAFSPAVNDLLVVSVMATTTVTNGSVTGSANGATTFTLVDRSTSSSSIHSQYIFVADALTTGTASMTVTFDCTADAATGAVVMIARVAGMTNVGAAAILQSTKQDNGTGGTTPAPVFASSCLTTNPTIVVLGQISLTATTAPTNWTKQAEGTYSTPTTGAAYVSRDSGFTGTTITWGSTATAFGDVAVELDASAPSGIPDLTMAPRR